MKVGYTPEKGDLYNKFNYESNYAVEDPLVPEEEK